MGNYSCIHCGIPRDYYTDREHYSRKSCRSSHDNFHDFKPNYIIIVSKYSNKVENSITNCLKKTFTVNRNNEVNIELSKYIMYE